MLHLHSFAGFAKGLALLTGFLQNDWQCLHPEHDPYDDYPIERVNALSELGHHTFVLMLKKHPLVAARGLGQFSFDDIQSALESRDKSKGDNAPDSALINATFKACEVETLQQTAQSVTDALQSLQSMYQILQDAMGAQYAPDFSKVIQLLANINKVLHDHLPEPLEAELECDIAEEVQESTKTVSLSQATRVTTVRSVTTIENREDVNRALNKICHYYEKHEPSSPVPLFLKRAQRLVDKSFVELMQDLSPNSVNELQQLFGTQDENK
jgi:type VI secretion system protein ImpA